MAARVRYLPGMATDAGEQGDVVGCTQCGEPIMASAVVCKHCGRKPGDYDKRGRRRVPASVAVLVIVAALVVAVVVGVNISDDQKARSDRNARENVCADFPDLPDC